jgi:hypothetical protein
LIDSAEALDRLVGAQQRVHEGHELSEIHDAVLDGIAGIKKEQAKNQRGEDVHQR